MFKKIICLLLLTLLQAGMVSGQNWQFDYSPTRQNLARLDLLSDSLGWAVSYDGLLLKYNGKQWAVFDSLSHFASQLLATEDSLLLRYEKIGDIYTIRAPNTKQAWLAVNNVSHHLYKMVRFDVPNNHFSALNFSVKIRSIDFWNDEYGIAVGQSGGYLYKEGVWKPLRLPLNVDFKCVKFVNQRKILICGEKGVLLQGDGVNWQRLETGVNVALRDVSFISDDEGWIVGYNGVILHYLNGRLEQQIAETVNNLWAVSMLPSGEGYAVGEKGTLLKYHDGYWDIIGLDSDIDFHDIEMLNGHTGFIVGARGAIVGFREGASQANGQHHFLFTDQVHLGSDYLMDRIDDVYGITVSDFNGDQRPDIYLTCYKSLNHLLINQGKGYYRDQVIESGTGGNIETRVGLQKYEYGSLAADFDRDGDTDLLLCGKRQTSRYFTNKGQADFKDLTRLSGLPDNLEVIDGALADFNKDGYPDFVLADVNRGLRIFLNMKYNHFQEQILDSLNLPATGIRAVKVGDLNQDNRQDILAIYQNHPPLLLVNTSANRWRTAGEKLFAGAFSEFINSVTVCDINRDGINDLYFCTENSRDALYIYNPQTQRFENQSAAWGILSGGRSYSCVPGDFDLDGYTDLFISRYGPDFLYLNQQNKTFREVAEDTIYSKAGFLSGYNTGAACLDVDGNHSPDIIVGNTDYWSSLLQNLCSDSAFIEVRLNTTQDTKEALGAKIWLWPAGARHTSANLIGFKEVLPSNGLFSQNENVHLFRVQPHAAVDLKIRFLNGVVKNHRALPAGTTLTVSQTGWLTQQSVRLGRAVLQFLHIPYMIWEIIKFVLFILFILGSVRFIENRYRWRPAHTALYVLSILMVYIVLTMVMDHSGALYHVLPFAMIVFALLVLVAVNEPIRKINHLRELRQKELHEASMRLAASPEEEQTLAIIRDTLKLIYPYRLLLFYTYYFNGNYLLFREKSSRYSQKPPAQVILGRETVNALCRDKGPVSHGEFSAFWPSTKDDLKNSLFFPLNRKNKLLGVVIIAPENEDTLQDEHAVETIRYLFLQLSIALDNIRILHDLQEQEKIAAIGSFSGGIIHNLKNPIDGLRMIIEVIKQETAADDPKKEYVEELYKGILQLKQKLIHSFDFIHYAQSKKEEIDVNGLIRRVVQNFDGSANGIIRLNLSAEALMVTGDAEQLIFSLENIIQNALEASDLSRPVTISTWSEAPDALAVIQVEDKGRGIRTAEMERIFNLFYSTKGKSRGLGLTITRNIIRNHKGYIDVLSEKDKGTRFKIFLPQIQKDTHE